MAITYSRQHSETITVLNTVLNTYKWQENNPLRPDEKWTVRRWNKNRLNIERV